MDDYELIDSGVGRRLERFGKQIFDRPCSVAIWQKSRSSAWKEADAIFDREKGWQGKVTPSILTLEGVRLKIEATDFGHLGVFAEHQLIWKQIQDFLQPGQRFLNLFAYTGAASIVAAKAGAQVCHLDASKPIVTYARENAKLNGMSEAPIRWIVDDVMKFLKREVRRESAYDLILLDPPTFGRGPKGELFKIEEEIQELCELCFTLTKPSRGRVIFSCHTPGYTPTVLENLLLPFGKVSSSEILLQGERTRPLPLGAYAIVEGK